LLFWLYIFWSVFWGQGLIRVVRYEGGSWRTPITFDRGFVLVWDEPVDDSLVRAGTIAFYAPDGRKLHTTSLKAPGGEQSWVVSGAIDADGAVAAVFNDRAHPQNRGVALIDSSGKVATLIDPGPYFPGHICCPGQGEIYGSLGDGALTNRRKPVRVPSW